MSVRTSVEIRGVSKFNPKAQMTSSVPQSGSTPTRFASKKPEHGKSAEISRQPPCKIPGTRCPIKWQTQPPGKWRLCGGLSVRSVLIPPVSAVSYFVGNVRLLGLVVVIEMPWEIADGTEPKHEKEQHALRGLARHEAREKFSKGFQKENVLPRGARASRMQRPAGLPVFRWNFGSDPCAWRGFERSSPSIPRLQRLELGQCPACKSIPVLSYPFQRQPRYEKRNTDCNDDVGQVVCSHHDA